MVMYRFGRVDACAHLSTVEVINFGLARTVCEQCGHVAIRPVSSISGQVDRSRFERRSER